ncbi:hypothetical protein V8C42DRAFT_359753 [Trichoderma barbatum]
MSRNPPSRRWTSIEGWNYDGMRERLEGLLAKLDKEVLLHHTELINGQKFIMSELFSAGQYWICFEMIAEDSSLVIARVRLPRHPLTLNAGEEDEQYAIVRDGYNAFREAETPGLGCARCAAKQERIMAQWTMIQTSLATLTYPLIGSISTITETGEPVIGRLSCAAAQGLDSQGPFRNAGDYFGALGRASLRRARRDGSTSTQNLSPFFEHGALVLLDIVQSTTLFQAHHTRFPLNHMDLGTQNILVDDDLNFVAVIDWEFAQTAPWPVNHYPMPFPLLWPDERIENIQSNPKHRAHGNVSRQTAARQLYCSKFREAEATSARDGVSLDDSFPQVLQGAASRVYACFSKLGDAPEQDEDLVNEMARLAFGFNGERTKQYLQDLSNRREYHGG